MTNEAVSTIQITPVVDHPSGITNIKMIDYIETNKSKMVENKSKK